MNRTLIAVGLVALLAGGAVGCIEDAQSLLIANAVVPDPDDECLVEVDLSSGSGGIRLETQIAEVGAWDLGQRSDYFICPEIVNLMQPTRDLGNLKGEANLVTLESYQVKYDWGEDLGFDLGPGSVPWELGITNRYRDLVTVSIPPGGRYIFCVPLVPLEVGERVADAAFWQIPLDPDPDVGRRYAPSFRTIIKFYGTTTGGREMESNEFMFRVRVERGWLFGVPNEAQCCDSEPEALPCFVGQDYPRAPLTDCRFNRAAFDALYGLGPDVDGDGNPDSQCCPLWPACGG